MNDPKAIESETRGGSCAPAPCSAFRALDLCEFWTRKDRDIYADAPFVTRYDHRLACIAEGQSDVRRLEERITSLQQDMRTIMTVTRWEHQAHQIAQRALTPNDPKLSDSGGWRAGCVVGERRRQEAASVTAVAVRCSAWLN